DAAQRGELRRDELEALAHAGAFSAFGLERREALWQAAAVGRDAASVVARVQTANVSPPPPMTALQESAADYAAPHLTAGPPLTAVPHIRAQLRNRLRAVGILGARELDAVPHGARVRVAGHVIVRQRPGTAKGFCFLTLEDETGTTNAVVTPARYDRWRVVINTSPLLEVQGPLQPPDRL